MLHAGQNWVDGIPVEVVRKRLRRINLRVRADGSVCLSVPLGRATLREGEAFLLGKLDWVRKTRGNALAHPRPASVPLTQEATARLRGVLADLQAEWTARLHEPDVTWKLRRMRSLWGSCHFRKRVMTYNTELAHAPRELVEYVVVHELTHLVAHNHGPSFQRHMDERLPAWRELRRRLNRREFGAPPPTPPAPPTPARLVQAELALDCFHCSGNQIC